MSRRERLKQRIQQNPKNVSFRALRVLLEAYGFELKRSKGSHHSFVKPIRGRSVLLVVPFEQPLKPVYVRRALALIEQVEAEEAESDDGAE